MQNLPLASSAVQSFSAAEPAPADARTPSAGATLDDILERALAAPRLGAAPLARVPRAVGDYVTPTDEQLCAYITKLYAQNQGPLALALGKMLSGEVFAERANPAEGKPGRDNTARDVAYVLARDFPKLDPAEVAQLCAPGIRAASEAGSKMTVDKFERQLESALNKPPTEGETTAAEYVQHYQNVTTNLVSAALAANTNAGTLLRSSIAQRLSAQTKLGPRHPTGISALDGALRGGMPLAKVMGLCGAPNAGKTSVACQIADHFSRTGVAVGWCTYDGSAVEIDARRLQALGVLRKQAEEPDAATLERADRELGPLPFEMYDFTSEGRPVTVEQAALDLAQRYPNQPRCLVVDSIQKAPATGTSKRESVDAVMAAIRNVSLNPATSCMVIFTSEVARDFYRNEAIADGLNDLAAAKESGDIEYVAQVILVLRSAKGGEGLVTVSMPKNKIGTEVNFTLKQDPLRCTFTPVADVGVSAKHELRLAPLKAKALKVIGERPGIETTALKQAVGGEAKLTLEAINALVDGGMLRRTAAGKGWAFFLAHDAPSGPAADPSGLRSFAAVANAAPPMATSLS